MKDRVFKVETDDLIDIDDVCNANRDHPFLITKDDKADLMVMSVDYYNLLINDIITKQEDQMLIEADLTMRYNGRAYSISDTLYDDKKPIDDDKVAFTAVAYRHMRYIISLIDAPLKDEIYHELKSLRDLHKGKPRMRGIFKKNALYELIYKDLKFIYRIYNDTAYIMAVFYRRPINRRMMS